MKTMQPTNETKSKSMKKFVIREAETLKTTAACTSYHNL